MTPRFAVLGLLLVSLLATAAQAAPMLEGRILDADGNPIPECRVIAREAEGATFFVSPPSDGEGHWSIELPAQASYVLVAAVSPTGGRVELADDTPFQVGASPVTRDITLDMAMAPDPRNAVKETEDAGVDRFFLSFVEDPALAQYRHYEVRLDYRDVGFGESPLLEGIVALQLAAVPRVELGARGGFADIDIDGLVDDSGATDLDIWGKFHMWRSGDTRMDLSLGVISTLPTGDPDAGLGRDAVQSKVFVGGSYAWASSLFVMSMGFAAAENGEVLGANLEGEVAPTASVGLMVPFARGMSAVFEASYEGERFKDIGANSQLLAGLNWRFRDWGQIRLAGSKGVGETSDLARIIVGFAFGF